MHWQMISALLCVFGLLKDFRPSESFVTDYLTGPYKNFTDTQVNQDLYPIATYAYFATLVVVFLITDFLRYKPIIILCGLSGALSFTLMILGKNILTMQILEFFYGLFLSAEVAYYTYIYAKVDKKHYQEVTGHTKAASLIGRCTAGIVAQLTTSFDLLDYHQLNYLTVGAYVLATIWALFLPSVGQSIYFHRENTDPEVGDHSVSGKIENGATEELYRREEKIQQKSTRTTLSLSYKIRRAYYLLWKDCIQAYSNSHVIKWSAWWALSTCGYLQVANYIQLLWQDAVEPDAKIYNGAVDCVYALIGAITVFCVGKLPLNWSLIGDITVSIFSFLEGILLVLASTIHNIWFLYGAYIVFGIVYHTMVTVASFEVAKYISEDSYGLIFGINIFFALLFESILTAIVLNGSLSLHITTQYYIYGGYFIVIAVIYVILGVLKIVQTYKSGEELQLWVKNNHDGGKGEIQDDAKSSKSENQSL